MKLPDRKSTRLNSSHLVISYAVFCLKKKKKKRQHMCTRVSLGAARTWQAHASLVAPAETRGSDGCSLGASLSFDLCLFFFFNDTATTEIYTLSLHDALPI